MIYNFVLGSTHILPSSYYFYGPVMGYLPTWSGVKKIFTYKKNVWTQKVSNCEWRHKSEGLFNKLYFTILGFI